MTLHFALAVVTPTDAVSSVIGEQYEKYTFFMNSGSFLDSHIESCGIQKLLVSHSNMTYIFFVIAKFFFESGYMNSDLKL